MAILDRVKKLMALSHSTNVHEAAQAAAMAQQLMLEHRIELADLSLNSNEKRLPEEVVETGLEGEQKYGKKKARAWRISLASRIATAFNSKIYYTSGTDYIGILGCKSDVETCQYLQQYFGLEIERLAEAAWRGLKAEAAEQGDLELPRPSTWKASFRDGAVHAIGEKLKREKLKTRLRTHDVTPILNIGLREELEAEIAQEDAEKAAANPAALVLVRREEQEREATVQRKWTERFTKNGRSTLGRSTIGHRRSHSQDGFAAGKAAGAGISYGGQRTGIAGSKARLEG